MPAAVIKSVSVDQNVFLEVLALADSKWQCDTLWEQLISLVLSSCTCLSFVSEQIDPQLETLVFPELSGTAKFSAQEKSYRLLLRTLSGKLLSQSSAKTYKKFDDLYYFI